MRKYFLMSVVLFLTFSAANPARAVPISYTFEGVGTGSLGGTAFTSEQFTISVSADTDLVVVPFPGSSLSRTENLAANISFSGGSGGIFTVPTSTVVRRDLGDIIFGRLDFNLALFSTFRPEYMSYDLISDIGPLTDLNPEIPLNQFSNVPLDTGLLTFSSIDTITFQAAVVPIPAAVWLFCSGLLGMIGIARRKKAA